jgi:hypothetical protein
MEKPIFSGPYSRKMWKQINKMTIHDSREVLYLVCCRINELEAARISTYKRKLQRKADEKIVEETGI